MLIELTGIMHVQSAVLDGLLELLIADGVMTDDTEAELFNLAQTRLERIPESTFREFAHKLLRAWRDEELARWRDAVPSRTRLC